MCRSILCASSLVIVRFVHMFVFCYIVTHSPLVITMY